MIVRSPKLLGDMFGTITVLVLLSSLAMASLAVPCGLIIAARWARISQSFGEPALVALAPRGHAAFQPVRLDLQLGVELFGGAGFLGIDLFLGPGLIAAKADLLAAQQAPVEPECLPRQPVRKVRSWLMTMKAPL
jgi:hypothetical protein